MNTGFRRVAIFLAAAAVSTSAIFTLWSDASSITLVFYRMLFASLIILPFLLIGCRKELRSLELRDLILCIISGFVLAIHFAAYFESLRFTSITSSLVLVDTSVFFIAAIMLIFFREKISVKGWIAIMITFGGVVVIALNDFHSGNNSLYGDILALLGSVMFAGYAVIGRRQRSRMSTTVYTFIVYLSAALTALLVCVSVGDEIICDTADLLCALGMAVFCTILGHSVFNWGLKYEKTSFIAVSSLLEPVFGSVLGFLVFSEIPATLIIIGSLTVLFGVYLFSANTEPELSE